MLLIDNANGLSVRALLRNDGAELCRSSSFVNVHAGAIFSACAYLARADNKKCGVQRVPKRARRRRRLSSPKTGDEAACGTGQFGAIFDPSDRNV